MRPTIKTFAKPMKIDPARASALEGNLASDEFVFYTGGAYKRRPASGRSCSLSTVTEKRKPISLNVYVQRALKAGPNGTGYDTSISVGGLGLHQGAKPAVYLYLVKDTDGNYRAKKDIPNPDFAFSEKPIAAGDIVVPAPKKGKKGQAVIAA